MRRKQTPGPGRDDGEERGSSPSSFPGTRKDRGKSAGSGNRAPQSAGPAQPAAGGHDDAAAPGQSAGPVRPELAAGFDEGGAADVLGPGAELAGLVTAVIGPGGAVLGTLTDREVLGVLGAGHKLAAWAAWVELVALAEFTRRRPALAMGISGARAAAEEAAWVSAESWSRMLDQAVLAQAAVARLPQTLAAMGEGTVSAHKLTIIAGQTEELLDEDAAKADVVLAAAAMVRNPAALRDFARRQVARLDPEALLRRKERALRKASVRVWQEDSGNMGLSAREMPNGDGQVAWQNIERRALDLHAAGMAGTTGQLQVQAMLDFLLGRATPGPDEGARQDAHVDEGARQDAHVDEGARQDAHGGADGSARQDAHDQDDDGVWDEDEDGEMTRAWLNARENARENARVSARENARTAGRGGGRGGWAVNPVLVVPWDPVLGRPSGPAGLPGYGLLDEDDTMELLDAAGQDPDSRWCLTATGADGTAAAHGCLAGPRTLDAVIAAGQAAGGTWTAADLAAALGADLEPVARGACDHAHAEPGYRPSRRLRHLVGARNARCAAYGCGRPAAACDYDHTVPWDDGGLTCECNIAPLCRRHHQIKQAQGWKLEQPEPGVLIWATPAGLTRITTPTSYGI